MDTEIINNNKILLVESPLHMLHLKMTSTMPHSNRDIPRFGRGCIGHLLSLFQLGFSYLFPSLSTS
jgi:hypothetical protein